MKTTKDQKVTKAVLTCKFPRSWKPALFQFDLLLDWRFRWYINAIRLRWNPLWPFVALTTSRRMRRARQRSHSDSQSCSRLVGSAHRTVFFFFSFSLRQLQPQRIVSCIFIYRFAKKIWPAALCKFLGSFKALIFGSLILSLLKSSLLLTLETFFCFAIFWLRTDCCMYHVGLQETSVWWSESWPSSWLYSCPSCRISRILLEGRWLPIARWFEFWSSFLEFYKC